MQSCISVPAVEGGSKRLTIKEPEAVVVRRIFELSASGVSLKATAKKLNADCVAAPRSRVGRRPMWCPTAVRAMLKRELYKGEVIWNRSKFEKVPGTNKRRRKMRRETEWQRIQHPELAIVPVELWDKVQRRLQFFNGLHKTQKHPGLLPRSFTSQYLFSGLLKCGTCGGNLIIATGGGTHRHQKYVCSSYVNRGTCKNDLYIRRDHLQERLLGRLQSELLRPDVIDYAVSEFGRQLRTALRNLGGQVDQMRKRKQDLEPKIQNLVIAIAEHGHSSSLLEELAQHEGEMQNHGPGSFDNVGLG
jgi:site-specific DNA recombinase